MDGISIRLAQLSDAEAIRSIYNHEVLTTTATFDLVPRSLSDQQSWLAARTGAFAAIVAIERRTDEPHGADASGTAPPDHRAGAGVGADVGVGEGVTESVVGFGSLSPYKERAAYRTSVEDSVYVRRDRHGRGIGRMIVEALLDIADQSGFHTVFARIEASGSASRALHARCGFQLVGVERETGRKFNRWLDIAVMQCLLHERAR